MEQKHKDSWHPLRKNYPNSEKVNKVSDGAETLFTRLIAAADDNGNYWGSPFLLMSGLYKLKAEKRKITEKKVRQRRNELVREGLICLYEKAGREYVHITNCKRHLRKDVRKDVRFPEFTQSLVVKELPESVTDTARKRNEDVATYSYTDSDSNSDSHSVICQLFDHWNSFKEKGNKWKSHKEMTYEIESAIRDQLKHYTFEQLKGAIDNYACVLLDKDYNWSYAWTLRQFLTRKQKPPNEQDLQLYRFLDSRYCDDYLKDSARDRRAKERKRYYDSLKTCAESKLIEAYRENKNNLNWLIDEIRPEIRGLCEQHRRLRK
jgi:hypothetical protein